MSDDDVLIRNLGKSLDIRQHATVSIYQNTKMLLELYPKVYWRLETQLDELDAECLDVGNKHLKAALDELSCLVGDIGSLHLQNRMCSLLRSRSILQLVDKALVMLKEYPNHGATYFSILEMAYLSQFPLSEGEIITILDKSRSTYYKLKKEAIQSLGVILWGFIIPEVQSKMACGIA